MIHELYHLTHWHDQERFTLVVAWLLVLTVLAVHAWWNSL